MHFTLSLSLSLMILASVIVIWRPQHLAAATEQLDFNWAKFLNSFNFLHSLVRSLSLSLIRSLDVSRKWLEINFLCSQLLYLSARRVQLYVQSVSQSVIHISISNNLNMHTTYVQVHVMQRKWRKSHAHTMVLAQTVIIINS